MTEAKQALHRHMRDREHRTDPRERGALVHVYVELVNSEDGKIQHVNRQMAEAMDWRILDDE